MATCNVLLAGRSLLLSAVADCLRDAPGVRLIEASGLAEAALDLEDAPVDVVVFVLGEQLTLDRLSALFSRPELSLIGLDPERNRAVVLSGREVHTLTLQKISNLVTAGVGPANAV